MPGHSKKINPEATIRHLLGQVFKSDPVGTTFKYDNFTVIDILGEIIEAATQRNSVEFAYSELFEKIGILSSSWGNDFNSRLPNGVGGNWTCRGMASPSI